MSTLTSNTENRNKQRKSTFLAYIDFSKAYDKINLNEKLNDIGIDRYMYRALRSLYENVKCAVRVKEHLMSWFKVSSGLKQGCLLSTTMFNIYLTYLSYTLEHINIGVEVDGTLIYHLLYADDLVLIAENECDLQIMLNTLSDWCFANEITINSIKSKIMHLDHNQLSRLRLHLHARLKIRYCKRVQILGTISE